jgi:2,4-didehydro-3-deoxy-L-rhamnonate hydrolase
VLQVVWELVGTTGGGQADKGETMRLCRFDDDRLGLVDGETVRDVTGALELLPAYRVPLPRFDPVIAELEMLRPEILRVAESARPMKLTQVTLRSPVANPQKVVAAPVNYEAHRDEAAADPEVNHGREVSAIHRLGVFLKSPGSVVGASEGVALRFLERRNDHEIELAAIIGKETRHATRENALDCVAGYCIGLDMTLRGPEERTLRKSLDSYTVLGPYMVTADEIEDASALDFELRVNGEVRQSANTSELIVDLAGLIEMATRYYTLMPGDVLMTGTPEGVGPVKPGDVMTAWIEGIGTMSVPVRAA